MKSGVLIALSMWLMCPAWAGSQAGKIASVHVRASDGLAWFYMSGVASNKPGCATNPYWIIKDPQSAAGKQQIAILMSARAANSAVAVVGANTCTRWGDGEDVEELAMTGG